MVDKQDVDCLDEIDIFAELENTPPPLQKTPEEEFCFRMFMGANFTKADQLSVWLGHQISIYKYMFEDENVKYTRTTLTERGKELKEINQITLARYFIKYYLMMYHLPHFQTIRGITNVRVCDIEKVVTMILADKKIKDVAMKDH